MGAFLLFCIQNPAQVISLISTVIDLINRGVSWVDIQENLANFDAAAKNAQETKDTSGLENLFDPKSNSGNPPSS